MPMPPRVTYIVAQVDKAVAFEWLADLIDPSEFELRFILLNAGPSHLEDELMRRRIAVDRVVYRGYRDLPAAAIRVLRLLRSRRPRIVHAHMLPACIVGLVAATLTGVPMRVYTRHHSTFHHEYAPKWVLIDRVLNALATHIVAISQNVFDVLHDLERVPRSKLRVVRHGFRFEDFDSVPKERVDRLRDRYDLNGKRPVIGVIARCIAWKGHADIVPAATHVLEHYPDAVFVFANARGSSDVLGLIRSLPKRNVREIPFEPDLFALYRLFTLHVHTPVNSKIEAFGQTYVEALIAGVPSVFTLSGIATEFIEHERNALVVPYRSPDRIADAVLRLLGSHELRAALVEQGRRDVEPRFAVTTMTDALVHLYREASL
ncbi:MAG: glycosyltransferase family 4 protein [Deltaproteobacteria bacterium]|nr:glycosyltransferase family 4 protein [Deltaproteobacteria bacterium]